MSQSPAARCGECPNCKYIDATRRIILAETVSHTVNQASVDMWNKALVENPCIKPIVWVDRGLGRRVKGRIEPAPHGVNETTVQVLTIEHGIVKVHPSMLADWSPEDELENRGNYEQLVATLNAVPDTWVPALLKVVIDLTVSRKILTVEEE